MEPRSLSPTDANHKAQSIEWPLSHSSHSPQPTILIPTTHNHCFHNLQPPFQQFTTLFPKPQLPFLQPTIPIPTLPQSLKPTTHNSPTQSPVPITPPQFQQSPFPPPQSPIPTIPHSHNPPFPQFPIPTIPHSYSPPFQQFPQSPIPPPPHNTPFPKFPQSPIPTIPHSHNSHNPPFPQSPIPTIPIPTVPHSHNPPFPQSPIPTIPHSHNPPFPQFPQSPIPTIPIPHTHNPQFPQSPIPQSPTYNSHNPPIQFLAQVLITQPSTRPGATLRFKTVQVATCN
ncbi:extensin-like [Penaeus monodon]|uniref:extensin-like n=1 Tax=Penaeus monodon TaxID=6687 RepID=UPI0018A7ABFA|nr:extensin-like [Penaeus monodon]